MKYVMELIRGILWVALVATSVFACLLWYALPSYGDVAQLIEIIVGVALVVAWIAMLAWGETEEAREHQREKWAYKDRVEAEWALQDKILAVVPGGPLVLEHSLKRLAASRS